MNPGETPIPSPKLIRHESDDEIPSSFGSFAQAFREKAQAKYGARVAPDYTTVVDGNRRYVEVSDSFCELVGYRREELIGKQYDDLTAPSMNNIPVVFELFARVGYMTAGLGPDDSNNALTAASTLSAGLLLCRNASAPA